MPQEGYTLPVRRALFRQIIDAVTMGFGDPVEFVLRHTRDLAKLLPSAHGMRRLRPRIRRGRRFVIVLVLLGGFRQRWYHANPH